MSHVQRWEEGVLDTEDERGREVKIPTSLPFVKNDFVAIFEADSRAPYAPREVQVRWYRQLLWELQRRGFYVVRYTFDQFQSTDSQQIIELAGVETDTVSMDRNDLPWKTLRDVVYDGRFSIQYRESLREEIFALGRTNQGKVDHPPGGSKDEADALCGSVLGALVAGGSEDPDGNQSLMGGVMGPGGTDDYVEFEELDMAIDIGGEGDTVGDFDFFGIDDSSPVGW
jgi:hypothetical protein